MLDMMLKSLLPEGFDLEDALHKIGGAVARFEAMADDVAYVREKTDAIYAEVMRDESTQYFVNEIAVGSYADEKIRELANVQFERISKSWNEEH